MSTDIYDADKSSEEYRVSRSAAGLATWYSRATGESGEVQEVGDGRARAMRCEDTRPATTETPMSSHRKGAEAAPATGVTSRGG